MNKKWDTATVLTTSSITTQLFHDSWRKHVVKLRDNVEFLVLRRTDVIADQWNGKSLMQ